jgi:hypothetical protein
VAGVGCERQVPVVPRVDELRAELGVARHVVVRSAADARALPHGAQEGGAVAAASGER